MVRQVSYTAAAFLIALIVFVGPASADAFDDTFQLPDWKKHTDQHGFQFECVTESCGFGRVKFFGPSTADITALDREGVERLFDSPLDPPLKFLSFTVGQGEFSGWTISLERRVDGKLFYEVYGDRKFEKRRFQNSDPSARDQHVTFWSTFATNVEAAQRNFDKLVGAFLTNVDNLNKGR